MVDEEIVVDKLRYINEYTNDLKQMRGVSKTEYVDDVVVQRAVERTFMNLIQSCIDLSQHIRASEGFSPSGTAKNEIESLGNAGILSHDVQEQMEEAVGFRNILAHRYGDVNHDVVYTVLPERRRECPFLKSRGASAPLTIRAGAKRPREESEQRERVGRG